MATRPESHGALAETTAASEHERPCVERVLTPEEPEQEILYAETDITADN